MTLPWGHDHGMHGAIEHRPLCTIELIAEGHAERCPEAACPFWDRGCALARVELALEGRPEVARLLLDLRRVLEAGRTMELEAARSTLAHLLDDEEGIDASLRAR